MTASKKTPKREKTSPGRKAKTDSPQRILNIFINTLPDTKVNVQHWEIQPGEDVDPERVAVQTSDLCYSTILDPLEPKVETWGVVKNGELSKNPISSIGLPFVTEVPAK